MKIKRMLILVMTALFLFTAVSAAFGAPAEEAEANAVTVKLNKTSVEFKIPFTAAKISGTVKLKATVKGTSEKVKWSSSDVRVAKVNSSGKVTAVGEGTAKISAAVAGKTATCVVKIKRQDGTSFYKMALKPFMDKVGDTVTRQFTSMEDLVRGFDDIYKASNNLKKTINKVAVLKKNATVQKYLKKLVSDAKKARSYARSLKTAEDPTMMQYQQTIANDLKDLDAALKKAVK